jgi:predicted  nucleic acid-binding Zn-ribbon protein
VLPEIKQLLELQAIDERLADAAARVARLDREIERLHALIEDERASAAATQTALHQLHHDSRMKNLEVDDLDSQIRGYQKRLDEGIISFKEMEDLRVKIGSERTRFDRLEDDALSLMEAIEEKATEAASAETRLTEREAALRQQIGIAEAEIVETRAELGRLADDRQKATGGIPTYLVSQYETLHARHPQAVAEIRNGTCAGCKLRVSGNTTERARSEKGVVTCEHCSRILYTL